MPQLPFDSGSRVGSVGASWPVPRGQNGVPPLPPLASRIGAGSSGVSVSFADGRGRQSLLGLGRPRRRDLGLPFPRSHVDDSHVDETIASVVRDGRAEHQRPRCGTEDMELSRRRRPDLLGLAGPDVGFAAHRCRQRCRAARVGRADGILEVVVFFAVFASRDRSKAEDRVVTGSAVWARSTGSDQKTHGYGGDLESYMYRGLAIRPAIRP